MGFVSRISSFFKGCVLSSPKVIALADRQINLLLSSLLLLCLVGWTLVAFLVIHIQPYLGLFKKESITLMTILVAAGSLLAVLSAYIQQSFVNRAKRAELEMQKSLLQIEGMFSSLEQGIFLVVKGLKIKEKYSHFLEVITGKSELADKTIDEILWRQSTLGEEKIAQIRSCLLSSIGEDEVNYDLNAHVLPKKFTLIIEGKSKSIEAVYTPMRAQGKIDEILVILYDVTQVELLKEISKNRMSG